MCFTKGQLFTYMFQIIKFRRERIKTSQLINPTTLSRLKENNSENQVTQLRIIVSNECLDKFQHLFFHLSLLISKIRKY